MQHLLTIDHIERIESKCEQPEEYGPNGGGIGVVDVYPDKERCHCGHKEYGHAYLLKLSIPVATFYYRFGVGFAQFWEFKLRCKNY